MCWQRQWDGKPVPYNAEVGMFPTPAQCAHWAPSPPGEGFFGSMWASTPTDSDEDFWGSRPWNGKPVPYNTDCAAGGDPQSTGLWNLIFDSRRGIKKKTHRR